MEELIVRSTVAGGARAVSHGGGTVVEMAVAGSVGTASLSGASWTRVWSSTLGSGSYSLDGLHVRFAAQEVSGLRLSSSSSTPASSSSAMAAGSGTFEGWGAVTVHFGRAVGDGSVRVASSRSVELVSGEAMSIGSEAVTVSAGGSVEAMGSESVDVSGLSVSVQA
ncbi:MAG: hypothetical protein VYD05_16005, partial [Planctomycetota bacterium]|nr:hypothetical protein [Planctomycetota bacterium]